MYGASTGEASTGSFLGDIVDDVTDFISDPPLWVGLIGAAFTLGGYGGITGLLGQLETAVVQETMRSLPGLVRGDSFAAAWTGQWVARVKAAAQQSGQQFAVTYTAQPVQALTSNSTFVRDIAARYKQLQNAGADVETIGRTLLTESAQKCIAAGVPANYCRADVRAYAINYAVGQNLFNPINWDLKTGDPRIKETWDQIRRNDTRRLYTAAEISNLVREAEAQLLPTPIIAALREREREATEWERLAVNYGGAANLPQQLFDRRPFRVIDDRIRELAPPEAEAGNVTVARGPSPIRSIFTYVLLTTPIWAGAIWLGRRQGRGRSSGRSRRQRR